MNGTTSALLVTYVWPPTGGVGAQRVLKLAKYLPEYGVTPSVLTVANPSAPLVDHSLLRDVPAGIEVVRARTFEPGYAAKQAFWKDARADAAATWQRRAKQRLKTVARQTLIPDPQVLWQPDVQRILLQRLRRRRDDIVFFTGPPFSTFLSAPLVRAAGHAAVVLDYRDEWLTLRTQYEMLSRWGAAVGGAMEHAVLRCAHAVTVATDAFRDHLLQRFAFLDPTRVVTINNGYDPDDFPSDLIASARPPADRFVITYAGTIFKQNSPRGLLAALRLLQSREPELSRLLTVRFIGRIVDTEADAFEGTEALGVERVGFIDRDKIAPALAASHMTLCLLDIMPGAERIYPAKIFELMMIGRPSLTLTPPGVLADLARRHQLGPVVAPRDAEAIAVELASVLRAWRAGTFSAHAQAVGIERYHRRAIADQFADVFRAVAAAPR
jgi:glycosyltransferase involved in cell wall biosynthesis